jgi:hypothetical protein
MYVLENRLTGLLISVLSLCPSPVFILASNGHILFLFLHPWLGVPGQVQNPLHFIRQLLASDTQSEFFIGQFPFSNLGAEIALNRGCQMHITRFELYMNVHNGFCRFVLGYLCAFGLPFVLSLFRSQVVSLYSWRLAL